MWAIQKHNGINSKYWIAAKHPTKKKNKKIKKEILIYALFTVRFISIADTITQSYSSQGANKDRRAG